MLILLLTEPEHFVCKFSHGWRTVLRTVWETMVDSYVTHRLMKGGWNKTGKIEVP